MSRYPRGAGPAALAAALLCSACAPLTLTGQDNGCTVQMRPGKSFKLVLQSAAGNRWEVTELNTAVLRQGETLALAPDARVQGQALGAPLTMVMSFQAVAPGHTWLRLAYRAPQPGAAGQTYAADVTVR
jgi:predicted secreted protein